MLSDTDIHYLVGLLTKVQEAEDVVVELGDMVYDIGSQTKRDVDITATVTENDGRKSAYKGTEVKDHKRPLYTTQVEQLCLKFKDMPDITHRAIVSASGYTKPAIAKAESHDVELLEIVDWPDPGKGFKVQFDNPGFTMVEHIWKDGPHVKVNVDPVNYQRLSQIFSDGLPVVNKLGKPYGQIKTVGDLVKHVNQQVNHKAQDATNPVAVKATDVVRIDTRVKFDETPFLVVDGRPIVIDDCHVTGTMGFIVHDKPIFKVLRKQGTEKPLTGCAIAELSNKTLTGISVSNLNNKVTALNIPYSDRLKKKVRTQRLGGGAKPKSK